MLASVVLLCTSLTAADIPGGWDELFPSLPNFGRKVEVPKVEKGEKPTAYSQSANYDWMGGRFEAFTITLARDPQFKTQYAADAMKKEKVETLEVNKKTAYLWDLKPAKFNDLSRRLVVALADDKILIVEQRGHGLDVADVAKKLDFDKVLKALENPPTVKAK